MKVAYPTKVLLDFLLWGGQLLMLRNNINSKQIHYIYSKLTDTNQAIIDSIIIDYSL